MLYVSVTYWKGEGFVLHLRDSFYRNKAGAEAFGSQAKRLERDGNRLVLFSEVTGFEIGEAYDENVLVMRLKPAHRLTDSTNLDDYERAAIVISDFYRHRGLRKVTQLAYGVRAVTDLLSPQI